MTENKNRKTLRQLLCLSIIAIVMFVSSFIINNKKIEYAQAYDISNGAWIENGYSESGLQYDDLSVLTSIDIGSNADFAYIAYHLATGGTLLDDCVINITTNLDMNGFWWTGVNISNVTINGNGYTVSNLVFNNVTEYNGDLTGTTVQTDNMGLFGTATDCIIHDLKIDYVDFTASENVGAIVGNATNCNIYNCEVGQNVVLKSSTYAGGLVGFADGGTHYNNIIRTTSLNATYTGGIIGGISESNPSIYIENNVYSAMNDCGFGSVSETNYSASEVLSNQLLNTWIVNSNIEGQSFKLWNVVEYVATLTNEVFDFSITTQPTIANGYSVEVTDLSTYGLYPSYQWFKVSEPDDELLDAEVTNILTLSRTEPNSTYYCKVSFGNHTKNSNMVAVETHTITLDYLIEGVINKNVYVVDNQHLTYEAPAERNGYTFDNWYATNGTSSGDWGTYFDFSNIIDSSFTLYAKWNPKSYGYTIDTNCNYDVDGQFTYNTDFIFTLTEGAWHSIPTDITVTRGTDEVLTPSATTYSYNNVTGEVVIYGQAITADFTISAISDILKNYTISFNANGGSSVSAMQYNYDTPGLTIAETTTKENCYFIGWFAYFEDGEYSFYCGSDFIASDMSNPELLYISLNNINLKESNKFVTVDNAGLRNIEDNVVLVAKWLEGLDVSNGHINIENGTNNGIKISQNNVAIFDDCLTNSIYIIGTNNNVSANSNGKFVTTTQTNNSLTINFSATLGGSAIIDKLFDISSKTSIVFNGNVNLSNCEILIYNLGNVLINSGVLISSKTDAIAIKQNDITASTIINDGSISAYRAIYLVSYNSGTVVINGGTISASIEDYVIYNTTILNTTIKGNISFNSTIYCSDDESTSMAGFVDNGYTGANNISFTGGRSYPIIIKKGNDNVNDLDMNKYDIISTSKYIYESEGDIIASEVSILNQPENDEEIYGNFAITTIGISNIADYNTTFNWFAYDVVLGEKTGDSISTSQTISLDATKDVGEYYYQCEVKYTRTSGQIASKLSNPVMLKITPKTITITNILATTKTYDKSTLVTLNFDGIVISGVINSDNVTLVYDSAVGNTENANAGNDKTVNVTNISLSGVDAHNYVLGNVTTIVDISKVELSIDNVVATSKEYDNTTNVVVSGATLNGMLAGDVIALDSDNVIANTENVNVGNNKSVIISGYDIDDSWKTNYTLNQPVGVKVNITQADNQWVTTPSISDWWFGQTSSEVTGHARYGTINYYYKVRDALDSTYVSEKPTAVNLYTMKAEVEECTNYQGLSATSNFEIKQLYVNVYKNSETITSSLECAYNSNIDVENIILAGFTLTGIIINEESQNSTFIENAISNNKVTLNNVTNHINIKLVYSSNTYTIIYHTDAYSSSQTQITNGTKTHDLTYQISSLKYTRQGYTQTGWKDSELNNYAFNSNYNVNANLELFPVWTINTYNITSVELPGTIYSGDTSADYQETVTFTVTLKPGYKYISIRVFKTGDEHTTLTVLNDGANNMSFTQPDYNVTIESSATPNYNTPYRVAVWKQNTSGYYDPYNREYIEERGTTGTITTIDPSFYITTGFEYDSSQAGNVLSGEISGDGQLVLTVYLKRTMHTVTFVTSNGFSIPDETNIMYGSTFELSGYMVAQSGYVVTGIWSNASKLDTYLIKSATIDILRDTTVYVDYVSFHDGTGEGIEEDPFIIRTSEQLDNLLKYGFCQRNRCFISIANSISLSGGIKQQYMFNEHNINDVALDNVVINGNGNTITLDNTIYLRKYNQLEIRLHYGLFTMMSNSVIDNLIVHYINTTSLVFEGKTARFGGLIGYAEGCTIKNCTVTVDVSITTNTENMRDTYVGGLIGYSYYDMNDRTIENCNVNGMIAANITSVNAYIGGIVGRMRGERIFNSLSDVSIILSGTKSSSERMIGGIAGQVFVVGQIISTGAKGNITITENGPNNIIGGVAGQCGGITCISNSFFLGNVITTGNCVLNGISGDGDYRVELENNYSTISGVGAPTLSTGEDGTTIVNNKANRLLIVTSSSVAENIVLAEDYVSYAGYEYARWYAETDTFYPTHTPTFKVSYNGNGNTSGDLPEDNYYKSGVQNIAVESNYVWLVKTGYRLLGFNTDPNATTVMNTIDMGSEPIELYAIWILEYSISYYQVLDGVSSEYDNVYLTSGVLGGESFTIDIGDLIQEGYSIEGVYKDSDLSTRVNINLAQTIAENTNYYINYKKHYNNTGDGSNNNPYLISTAEQLKALLNNYTAFYYETYFRLNNDIDLSVEETNGLITNGINYLGEICISNLVFDGNNKTITTNNLSYNVCGGGFIGLFRAINESEIKNLNINANIDIDLCDKLDQGNDLACGVLCGKAENSRFNNIKITCNYRLETLPHTNVMFGAIVGYLINDTNFVAIQNCEVNNSTIEIYGAKQQSVGNLAGYLYEANVVNNSTKNNTININNDTEIIIENFDDEILLGGLVGRFTKGSMVNCYGVLNNISASSAFKNMLGGVIGQLSIGELYNCYSLYENASNNKLAGICYTNSADRIRNCYSNIQNSCILEDFTLFNGTYFNEITDFANGSLINKLNDAEKILSANNFMNGFYDEVECKQWYYMTDLLYPQFTPTYKVSYVALNKTTGDLPSDNYYPTSQDIDIYEEVDLTYTGYNFAGFNTNQEATTGVDLEHFVIEDHDVILYVIWTPATDTEYIVIHLLQNLNNPNFAEMTGDRQTLLGTTLQMTNAVAKNYKGFTPLTITQKVINADGSTIINIQYSRNSYNIIWKDWDNTEIDSKTLLFDANVTFSGTTPSKTRETTEFYNFIGWKKADDNNIYTDLFPKVDGNCEYVAQYKTFTTKYTNNNIVLEVNEGIDENVALVIIEKDKNGNNVEMPKGKKVSKIYNIQLYKMEGVEITNEKYDTSTRIIVRIAKPDEIKDDTSAKIILKTKSGDTININASVNEDVLVFTTNELGDFFILSDTPEKNNYVIYFVLCGILGVLVVLFMLLFVFKKKVTFMINGSKAESIKIIVGKLITIPVRLTEYEWFIDKKQTKPFIQCKMDWKNKTLYGKEKPKIDNTKKSKE